MKKFNEKIFLKQAGYLERSAGITHIVSNYNYTKGRFNRHIEEGESIFYYVILNSNYIKAKNKKINIYSVNNLSHRYAVGALRSLKKFQNNKFFFEL